MTTAMKSLAEMTTEELTSLKDATYDAAREQFGRMGMVSSRTRAYRELRQSCDETMRFMRQVDEELYRRGA